ncbi:MAG: hypothetical protein IPO21_09025 [Bacteroidales bacterium]|nr:hypothetical protein [Bacteroidales bacterium]
MAFKKFRALGPVQEALSSLGIEVSYAYDDLVFIEHNTFILRFDDTKDNHLFLHFNVECTEKLGITKALEIQFENHNLKITPDKQYNIIEKPGKEEFDLMFI